MSPLDDADDDHGKVMNARKTRITDVHVRGLNENNGCRNDDSGTDPDVNKFHIKVENKMVRYITCSFNLPVSFVIF